MTQRWSKRIRVWNMGVKTLQIEAREELEDETAEQKSISRLGAECDATGLTAGGD